MKIVYDMPDEPNPGGIYPHVIEDAVVALSLTVHEVNGKLVMTTHVIRADVDDKYDAMMAALEGGLRQIRAEWDKEQL